MSAKADGGLIGNHVGHRSALPTVDEGEEDSPETSSTPPDDVSPDETTQLNDDVDRPQVESLNFTNFKTVSKFTNLYEC